MGVVLAGRAVEARMVATDVGRARKMPNKTTTNRYFCVISGMVFSPIWWIWGRSILLVEQIHGGADATKSVWLIKIERMSFLKMRSSVELYHTPPSMKQLMYNFI